MAVKYSRIGLSVLLFLIAFISLISGFAEDQEPTYDTAVSNIRFSLRLEPDTKAKKGFNLKEHTSFVILEYTDENWCLVKSCTSTKRKGYAKKEWLDITPVPGSQTKSYQDVIMPDGTPAKSLYIKPVNAGKPYKATPSKTGIAIGTDETDTVRYECYTLKKINIREEPDDKSKRLKDVKKGSKILVIAYGDDWSKVKSTDNSATGYVKSKYLYRFMSYDPFVDEVPGWAAFKATGYITLKVPVHITDRKNQWGGNDLCIGDTVGAQMMADGTVRVILRRDWVDLDPDTYTYTPFTPWQEAEQGDIIGGYTVYYGKKQGGYAYPHRIYNITLAMSKMDNVMICQGDEFSYLTTVGPVTTTDGYKIAGITGGAGQGVGGGICHTASLTYDAALTLPFKITERRPHTDAGTSYMPLEFDATVGIYSDLKFINTLPYDVVMRAKQCKESCSISVWFERYN